MRVNKCSSYSNGAKCQDLEGKGCFGASLRAAHQIDVTITTMAKTLVNKSSG